MQPRIEILKPKKLIGIRMEMTLSVNKTQQLWQRFMPRRSEVKNRISSEFISMQNYGPDWIFDPEETFEKWAVVEVSNFSHIPKDMYKYDLPAGTYAVFTHQGPANTVAPTMHMIFGQWLPDSKYELDDREHFEILPEDYNPLDEKAEEEIWIPIKE